MIRFTITSDGYYLIPIGSCVARCSEVLSVLKMSVGTILL